MPKKSLKLFCVIILILMMFGHNYVLNQAQSLQATLQSLHTLTVPEFNLLYSIPSAVSIFLIIPIGLLYDKHAQKILLVGAISMLSGQILVTVFGPNLFTNSFLGLLIGRILECNGAQVLYMIQGNLASTWMSHSAGMIFILPQIGQIMNAVGTPLINEQYGITPALLIGLLTCCISFFACLLLYRFLQNMENSRSSQSLSIDDIVNAETEAVDLLIELLPWDNLKKIESAATTLEKSESQIQVNKIPKNIKQAGKVFWLILAVCSINECLYFPFLDNANVMIQTRFHVPAQNTGLYLCLPFISAIFTAFVLGNYILSQFKRKILIFIASLLPFVGHLFLYLNRNSQINAQTTFHQKIFLALGFIFFGIGLGAYYSISFPAVGYAVPQSIRGSAYACLCFCQTISMTLVPEISGLIIENGQNEIGNQIEGYHNSSLLFVFLSLIGVLLSWLVFTNATDTSFCYEDKHEPKNKQANFHLNSKTTLPS